MALHFVGFRDASQLYSATRIFGIPDFIHVKVDARFVRGGELDPEHDVIVFAKDAKVSSLQAAIEMVDYLSFIGEDRTVDDSDMSAIGKWHMRPFKGSIPW